MMRRCYGRWGGGLAPATNVIEADDTRAMAQFRRAYRKNLDTSKNAFVSGWLVMMVAHLAVFEAALRS